MSLTMLASSSLAQRRRLPDIVCGNDPGICMFHDDLECDDGGEGSDFSLCPWGSDCLDCGGRRYVCECCVVAFLEGAGSNCDPVPIWEFKDWSCPGGCRYSADLQKDALCDRVTYHFQALVEQLGTSADLAVDLNTESFSTGTLAGGASASGLYYRDPLCEREGVAADPAPQACPPSLIVVCPLLSPAAYAPEFP